MTESQMNDTYFHDEKKICHKIPISLLILYCVHYSNYERRKKSILEPTKDRTYVAMRCL